MTDETATKIFERGGVLSRDGFIEYLANCLKCNDVNADTLVQFARDNFDMEVEYRKESHDSPEIFIVGGAY